MEKLRDHFYSRRGIFYIIISGLGYGSLGIFTQLASSVHTLQSSTVRALFMVLLSLVVILASKAKPKCSKNEFLWILTNGSLGTAVQITLFMAYGLAPAGDVNAIVYSSPLFSGILARIFLNETLTCYETILSIVSIAGVFLISKPDFVFTATNFDKIGNFNTGILWALGALFIHSVQAVVVRKMRRDSTKASTMTFIFGVLALSSSAILNSLIGFWTIPLHAREIFSLIGVGVSGYVGVQFLVLALGTEKAVFATLGATALTMFTSYVLQFLIFRIYPDVISGTGIILIGSATVVALVFKWREIEETVVQQDNTSDSNQKDATTHSELAFDNPAMDYTL